ncbi:MAG: hypothetical protein JSV04_07790 [Candidatus Heimdallarchaeota archaeon]|nr:MAG: hypothetical protein JSV04_07790 [Candidatus Heimdallarchaeota archaeon]
MDVNNAINKLLVEFMKSTPGILQILFSDATGLVLSKVTNMDTAESDFEGIASISTALYLGMAELNLGELGFNQAEFSDRNLCLFGVTREYVLIAITRKKAPVKKIKAAMKELRQEVSTQLNLLKTSQTIEIKQEELYEKSKTLSEDDFNKELEKLLDELTF